MSTETIPHDDTDHEAGQHEHPSDLLYVKIALILGAITAAEVSTYFIFDDPYTPINVIGLLVMMVLKFATVGAYFMHLKFDNPVFRRVFIAGLVLAVLVYAGVMLSTLEFWNDNASRYLG